MLFIVVFNINLLITLLQDLATTLDIPYKREDYLTVQDSSGKYHNTSNFISVFKKKFTFSLGKVAISNVATSL